MRTTAWFLLFFFLVPCALADQSRVPPVPLTVPDPSPPAPPPPEYSQPREVKGIKLPPKAKKPAGKSRLRDRDVIQRQINASVQRPAYAMSVESKTIYSYVPDAIYQIYAAVNHVVDIQLQPGETIPGRIIAGDTHRWEVGTVVEGTGANAIVHVLLKPKQSGIETNFLIATDRHAYRLYAQSQDDFFIPTVGWSYPEEEMAKAAQIKQEQQKLDGLVAAPAIIAANLNFKYKIKPKGRYAWTPLRAFDDGSKTYIQMSPDMKYHEAPAFFIKDGKNLNLVNYRVKQDYYIVDRLFEEGELRSGKNDKVLIIRQTPWFFQKD